MYLNYRIIEILFFSWKDKKVYLPREVVKHPLQAIQILLTSKSLQDKIDLCKKINMFLAK